MQNKTKYEMSLIDPWNVPKAVVSGLPCSSIPLRREIRFALQTNSSGNFALFVDPLFLTEGTTQTTITSTSAASTFNGLTPILASDTNIINWSMQSSLTTNTLTNFRLVSAGIRVLSLSPVLNKQGQIFASLQSCLAYQPSTVGGSNTIPQENWDKTTATAISLLQAAKIVADVSNGYGVELIWVPLCPELTDFITMGSSHYAKETGYANMFQVVGLGLQASSFLSVNICLNYEVQARAGGSFVGMESIMTESPAPFNIWNKVLRSGLVARLCSNSAGMMAGMPVLMTQAPTSSLTLVDGNVVSDLSQKEEIDKIDEIDHQADTVKKAEVIQELLHEPGEHDVHLSEILKKVDKLQLNETKDVFSHAEIGAVADMLMVKDVNTGSPLVDSNIFFKLYERFPHFVTAVQQEILAKDYKVSPPWAKGDYLSQGDEWFSPSSRQPPTHYKPGTRGHR